MNAAVSPPADSERFGWLERRGDDFPYYRGWPIEISTGGWILVLAGVVLGFLVLTQGPMLASGTPWRFLFSVLYSVIPLTALAIVAGRYWTALFKPLRGVDFLWMIGFALLNLFVTLIVGQVTIRLIDTTANTAITSVGQMAGSEQLTFFALTGIQLVGEEVMSILPFLALMYWLCGRGGVRRKTAIVLATLVVALLFSAEHLPTYDWNVLQTLMGVGVARIVLMLPYILTKNLWVAAGAHILNDWIFFGISILGAATATGE